MNVADELERLQQLYQSGAIDDEEFRLAKTKLLREMPNLERPSLVSDPATLEQDTRFWGMLLHLSILAGFVVPLGGLVAPILIWQLKKDELPDIDVHGRNAVNWIISQLIYLVICILLAFVLIGLPMLIALGVLGVVFPIIAGVKANNGEIWKYPMSMTFV